MVIGVCETAYSSSVMSLFQSQDLDIRTDVYNNTMEVEVTTVRRSKFFVPIGDFF